MEVLVGAGTLLNIGTLNYQLPSGKTTDLNFFHQDRTSALIS
jgi:hypothetical protein